VKNKRDQSSHAQNSQGFSLEDEPIVEEFCSLVATILIRILASKGQEAYNCNHSDEGEATKQ
jgi:hypothetical protein